MTDRSAAPLRLLFFFALTGYSYLSKPGGFTGTTRMHATSASAGLQNDLVFTWAFIEMVTWFWVGVAEQPGSMADPPIPLSQIYVSLREDRKEQAARIFQREKAENNTL